MTGPQWAERMLALHTVLQMCSISTSLWCIWKAASFLWMKQQPASNTFTALEILDGHHFLPTSWTSGFESSLLSWHGTRRFHEASFKAII